MADITGRRIALVVDNYFEEAEFTGPLEDLQAAGATVDVVGVKVGELQSMQHAELSGKYTASLALSDVDFDNYDALVLPGGGMNADSLRTNQTILNWVKNFVSQDKLIAAICHAPWVLASANVLKDRKVTSFFTIQDDLRNAGADWSDQSVVVDGNLITSRQPEDVPAFDAAIISHLQTA